MSPEITRRRKADSTERSSLGHSVDTVPETQISGTRRRWSRLLAVDQCRLSRCPSWPRGEFKTSKRGSVDGFQDRGRMTALESNLRVMLTHERCVDSPTGVWDARSANPLLESVSVGMAAGGSFSRQLLHLLLQVRRGSIPLPNQLHGMPIIIQNPQLYARALQVQFRFDEHKLLNCCLSKNELRWRTTSHQLRCFLLSRSS